MIEENDISNIEEFKCLEETEVVKVKNCTYANDVKGRATFYFCQCASEDFFPVCAVCAVTCHKHHQPGLKFMGNYTCMCGKNNHHISKESEHLFKEKMKKVENLCFYNKFSDITQTRGKFIHNDKVYCSICLDHCMSLKTDNALVKRLDASKMNKECECERHYEMNVVNLNIDFLEKDDFPNKMLNFNFNIFSKIDKSRIVYIDYILNKMKDLQSNKSNSISFFTNFFSFKIFSLFTDFEKKYHFKYVSLKNFYSKFDTTWLISLISVTESRNEINSNNVKDLVLSKIYYSQIMFSTFVRSFVYRNMITFNLSSILNMNIYQRELYLLQSRQFMLHNPNCEENYEVINEFSNNFMDLYDSIIKLNENYNLRTEILEEIFPIFNKIFNFLIKYNLISVDTSNRYYEIVVDTLVLFNNEFDLKESDFSIAKSILYTLIYRNDTIFRMKSKKSWLPNIPKKFAFKKSYHNNMVAKVFTNILHRRKRDQNMEKTLKFDIYCRKIFELFLVSKSSHFYLKNMDNLLLIDDKKQSNLLSESMYTLNITKTNKSYVSSFWLFSLEFDHINRSYLQHEIDINDYVKQASKIFFQMINEISNEVDLSAIFCYKSLFIENDRDIAKIKTFQEAIVLTPFLQKFKEFLKIYADAIRFKDDQFTLNEIENEKLKFILKYVYLFFYNNEPNLCLFMSVNPDDLTTVFEKIQKDYFKFLKLISTMLFSKQYTSYQYDNYLFFCKIIGNYAERSTFENENLQSLETYGKVLKIFSSAVSCLTLNFTEILETIKILISRLPEIKRKYTQLTNFVNNYSQSIVFDDANTGSTYFNNSGLMKFLKNYQMFINKVYENNIDFFGILNIDCLIIEPEGLETLIFDKGCLFSSQLIIELIRFVFFNRINVNLNIKKTNKVITNFYTYVIHEQTKEIFLNPENVSLALLLTESFEETEALLSRAVKLLLFAFENAEKIIDMIIEQNKDQLKTKVLLLKFYQNCFVEPINILVNLYLLNSNFIKGSESYNVYTIVYNFLKTTVRIYDKIKNLESIDNQEMRETNIYEKNGIQVNPDSFPMDLEQIVETFDHCYKYFEIKKITLLFKSFVKELTDSESFIRLQTKIPSLDVNLKSMVYDSNKRLNTKLSGVLKNFRFNKLSETIKKYKTKMENTYDNNLTLFNILESSDSEIEIDMESKLYNYLQRKLGEYFSWSNLDFIDDEIKFVENITELSIKDFQIQFSYCLVFLNALFYNDSERFQTMLIENSDDSFDNFLKFFSKYLVFGIMMQETLKTFKLFNKSEGSITLEILKNSIKLMQNFCESHNQEFQDRFFNLNLQDQVETRTLVKSHNEFTEIFGISFSAMKKSNLFLSNKFKEMMGLSKANSQEHPQRRTSTLVNFEEEGPIKRMSFKLFITKNQNSVEKLGKHDKEKLKEKELRTKRNKEEIEKHKRNKTSFLNLLIHSKRFLLHNMYLNENSYLYETH